MSAKDSLGTRKTSFKRRETRDGYLFILPWLVGFCVFLAYPVISSLILSFTDYTIIKPSQFVGFQNYLTLVHDPLVWQSLKVTFIYAFGSVLLGMVISLGVALLLNQKIKGLAWFRTIYYMPVVISGVVISFMWMWLYNPDFGLINFLLAKIGIQGPDWIATTKWALPSIIIVNLWRLGVFIIIFLAGLQIIPVELYEVAEIDGAGLWPKFWRITLPMLSPVIFFSLIIQLIGALRIFTEPLIMTKGGPGNATLTYILYLYRTGFVYLKMGYASALAWVFFLIALSVSLLVVKSSASWVHYETEIRAGR